MKKLAQLPNGVSMYPLKHVGDARGFIREVFKSSLQDIFDKIPKQVTHSFMTRNVVKAWHYHRNQTDWWYVVSGTIRVGVFELANLGCAKPYSFTLRSTEPVILKICPTIVHGLKVLSRECHLIYFTDFEYDPNDEGRIPYNDPRISWNWGKNITVSPNDERFKEI